MKHTYILCIILACSVLFFAGCKNSSYLSGDFSTENESRTHYVDIYNYNIQPNPFPNAWKGLNAVIVEWGQKNEHIWSDSYMYDGQNFILKYIGIDIKIIKVYSETMTQSDIPEIETLLDSTTYLMIPVYYIDKIKNGNTSLVFLDRIAHITNEPKGETNSGYTDILGVRPNEIIDINSFSSIPVFHIYDGKVSIESEQYSINPKNGQYFSHIMNLLCEANEHIKNNCTQGCPVFDNGIDVEALSVYFSCVCEKNLDYFQN